MDVAEGARRMQVVGRCMNLTGAVFIVLNIVLMVSMQFSSRGLNSIMAPLAPLLIFALPVSLVLVLVGGVLWIAAWIVSGSAKPKAIPPAMPNEPSPTPTLH